MLSSAQNVDSIPKSENSQKVIVKYKCNVYSIVHRTFRDEGHSPLLHRGPSIQLGKYNERYRKNAITKLEFILGVGNLKTNKKNVNVITKAPHLFLEINYHYLYKIKSVFNNKGELYLGGIFSNTFDGRYYYFLPNNAFGYEFSNVINPATHLTYNFSTGKYGRNLQAGFKLNFALLAHVIRPNYIGMEPPEAYMEEKINALALLTHGNKIALPNQFFRLNTELYLDRFKLKSNDKIRIFYGWGIHYTNLPNSNPLITAYHTFGVVSMLYSEKTKKSIFKRNI